MILAVIPKTFSKDKDRCLKMERGGGIGEGGGVKEDRWEVYGQHGQSILQAHLNIS